MSNFLYTTKAKFTNKRKNGATEKGKIRNLLKNRNPTTSKNVSLTKILSPVSLPSKIKPDEGAEVEAKRLRVEVEPEMRSVKLEEQERLEIQEQESLPKVESNYQPYNFFDYQLLKDIEADLDRIKDVTSSSASSASSASSSSSSSTSYSSKQKG